MAKGKGFSRKSGASSEIPSSSMADIAFLLLIFFMVSTVFRRERNVPIDWTSAEPPTQRNRAGTSGQSSEIAAPQASARYMPCQNTLPTALCSRAP